jgi:uncharacterized sporulation protein YeaH/YhbH (DUF444 family)
MANIIDRRTVHDKSAPNRKKFMDRYRKSIKEAARDLTDKTSIKDLAQKGGEVKIKRGKLHEPTINKNYKTGDKKWVVPGNPGHNRGDTIDKPPSGKGKGGAGNTDDGSEDEFTFKLTRDEYLDILFEDLELPNWVAKTLLSDEKFKMIRAGFQNEGVPCRLDLKQTIKHSLARRISARKAIQDRIDEIESGAVEEWPGELESLKQRKIRYIDDVDLRYKQYVPQPIPDAKAVMFCIMDISGSMTEERKLLCKRFFLLLLIFLQKCYEKVEVVFIQHTTTASVVDEQEFFYSRKSGGTIISSSYEVLIDEIKENYPPTQYNIYVAQGTDGETWDGDEDYCRKLLEESILPAVCYFIYTRVACGNTREYPMDRMMEEVFFDSENINGALLEDASDCYKALVQLFHREYSKLGFLDELESDDE